MKSAHYQFAPPDTSLSPLITTGLALLMFSASIGYASHLFAEKLADLGKPTRTTAATQPKESVMTSKQHEHLQSTGPQVGYAAVMEDGTVYISSEKRPNMALPDINAQISQANALRYAVGKPAHEGPKHVGQLHPYYANANPDIQALLDGLCPERRIGCPAGSDHSNNRRRSDAPVRTQTKAPRKLKPATPTDDYESGLGWTERVA